MKTTPSHRRANGFLLTLCAIALGSMGAQAQATRTWVSGVGDDANPSSRTAPCKTFAGAISKTAAGGEINCIDPGGFGAVTITKSITIDGSGQHASILAAGTNGVIINAGVNGVVTLRNLSINGAGGTGSPGLNGVRILQAAEVNIENCVIYEFSQKGVDIAPSSNCRVNIKDTIIRGCGIAAIQSTPLVGADVLLTIKNSNMNASAAGLRADARTKGNLEDCELCGNTNQGILASSTSGGSEVMLSDCLISDNGTNGVSAVGAAADVRLSDCTVIHNAVGIHKQSSGQVISYGDNRVRLNASNGTFTSVFAPQ